MRIVHIDFAVNIVSRLALGLAQVDQIVATLSGVVFDVGIAKTSIKLRPRRPGDAVDTPVERHVRFPLTVRVLCWDMFLSL